MISDKVTHWFFILVKNKKAVFAQETIGGILHVIALNRAARRILGSNHIKKMATLKKCTIEENTIF